MNTRSKAKSTARMNTEETISVYFSLCLSDDPILISSPTASMVQVCQNQSIDPEIIAAFNNKSFTSIDSSFDGFSSDSHSNDSKLNFWGVESFKKVAEKLAILENSLTIEKLNNDILKDQIHNLEKKNFDKGKSDFFKK